MAYVPEKPFYFQRTKRGFLPMPRTKGTKRRANGTGRVYKSNGVYYLQYRLPNGSRKSVTLKADCLSQIPAWI